MVKKQINKLDLNALTTNEKGEVIIVSRTDETPLVHKLAAVTIAGTIDAVTQWLKKRGANVDLVTKEAQHPVRRSHILFSYRELFIKLIADEQHPLKDSIVGRLVVNPDLAAMQLNTKKKFDSKELSRHLKFNRYFFADRNEHAQIVARLQSYKAKITTDIEKIHNTATGDKRDLYEIAVAGNQPMELLLMMPLYVGQPAVKFKVEVSAEAHANGVDFYLESPDLVELSQQHAEKIIDEQIAGLQDKGYVLIQQG